MKTLIFITIGILLSAVVYAATPTIITLPLGKKTLVNLPLAGKTYVEFTCYQGNTSTAQAVKFGLNSSVVNHLSKSSGEYNITPGFAKRFTFQPHSSANLINCGVLYR
jgi:hypothetical protein